MNDNEPGRAEVPAMSMLKVWRDVDQTLVVRLGKWGVPTGVAAAALQLYVYPQASEPAQIASAIHIPRQSMTGTLDALEELGMARRMPHPVDRRRKQIELTEKGREFGKQVLADLLAFEDRVMDILSPAERETLQRLAVRVGERALAVSAGAEE